MGRFASRCLKFCNSPTSIQLLYVESALWLGAARIAVKFFPFKRLAPFLGAPMKKAPTGQSHGGLDVIKEVSKGVETMARHLPWECRCLVQAVAAKKMLDRRQIPATLYLGVTRQAETGWSAHAWTRSGDVILTGDMDLRQFAVVSTFS